MDCHMPSFPVHHHLQELAQTHVHKVGGSIQPSHLLLSPSPLALIFPSIRVFSKELVPRIRWTKMWSFSFSISPSNEHSGLISLALTGLISLQSKGLSRVFSNTIVQKFKIISSSVLSLLYGPTLTSMHDYWKNHSFD